MINLGLARVRKLLACTPITWKAVHIAGTNGKGSVASIVSSILHASGVSVGRFNSPHLIDRWDCISIDQKTVSKSVFLKVENSVKARNEAEKIDASEFELLTATAFEIFTGAEVQVGVVECGLGGRLDATNVLTADQVLCSVITKIGIDHEALLGNTITKIAQEKAGIFKNGVPFVVDQSNSVEVLMTLGSIGKESGAIQGAYYLPPATKKQISSSPGDLIWGNRPGLTVDSSQWPQHQQQNLETALLTCSTIQTGRTNGWQSYQSLGPFKIMASDGSLAPKQISAIVTSQHSWPGRLQLINTSKITGNARPMLLDGAHNEQAALVLEKHVDSTYRISGPVMWVIAMSKGKSAKDIVAALLRRGDQVLITQFGPVDGMPWVQSETMDILKQSIEAVTDTQVHMEPEPWNALRRASDLAGYQNQVVICGSLYLAGDVLRMLKDEPTAELEGLKWTAWAEQQRRKLELRRRRVFD